MMRITIHDDPRTLTFRLEGKLAGPWVRELEECWRGTLANQGKPIIRVDLSELTFIDAAGRACLKAMHREGAEFVAADCLMKAVVAEITGDNTCADSALVVQSEGDSHCGDDQTTGTS
jgi:hypothetical protein